MATLNDMLLGSAIESSKKAPDALKAMQTGAQLAQAASNVQAQRAQMEQQKEQIQVQKADKIMEAIEKGNNFKDKAAQNLYFKNHVPGMVKALKMEEFFNPEIMSYIQQSPDVRNKLVGLRLDIQDKINNGQLKGANILQYAQSKLTPEELPMLDTDSLLEQQKFAASEEGKSYRAQLVQQGQGERQGTQIDSKGKTALAETVAKQYADYIGAGGRASINASLKKLDEAATALETGKVVTGGKSTVIPGFKSDEAQSIINPQLVEMKSQAQSALNSVLRQTLGAQFTEAEGTKILNQVWDDKLAPKVNAKKVRDKIAELRTGVKDKEKLFKEQGFKVDGAKTYNVGGIEMDEEKAKAFYKAHPQFLKDEKLKKELGL